MLIPKMPMTMLVAGTGGRYSQLCENFWVYSELLKAWILAPAGFIMDWESTLCYRGKNPIGGLIHDLLSRSDAIRFVFFTTDYVLKKITKEIAADVYQETSNCEDKMDTKMKVKKEGILERIWDWITAKVKSDTVDIVPDCVYWQKHPVMATYEELAS